MPPYEVRIPMVVKEDRPINIKIKDSSVIKLNVENYQGGGGEYPIYYGPTVVTPMVHRSVELETKNKSLLSNIVVDEIPYFETTNPNGITFVIGG